jgi:hypothetical protein
MEETQGCSGVLQFTHPFDAGQFTGKGFLGIFPLHSYRTLHMMGVGEHIDRLDFVYPVAGPGQGGQIPG